MRTARYGALLLPAILFAVLAGVLPRARAETRISIGVTETMDTFNPYADSVSLMYAQPSGSGSRYQGRNESFWEHQGEAVVTWGYEAPEMRCKKALTR